MRNFDEPKRAGVRFSGGRVTITKVAAARNDGRHGAQCAVDVTIDVQPLAEINHSDKVVARSRALHNQAYRVWLSWLADMWTLVDFKEVIVR
jgi:hypothetical protein